MNVFDYAMKMEMDGKSFYEEHAAKVDNPALKRILLELAKDEQKHYNLFKAMRDGKPTTYDEGSKTTILTSIKNVFEDLKGQDGGFSFPADAKQIWEEAREIEKKSEAFYREKAKEMDSADQANVWNKIADEEHRHWVTMENVIGFLDRPEKWLEDAEWNHLEQY